MEWRDAWRALFPRRHIEADVHDEITFHIEERIRELKDRGWSDAEARAEVLRQFGDVGSIEAACQHYDQQRVSARGRRWMVEAWVREARWAARSLRRSPGFTTVVIVTLALGIGASTAVFSVLESVLLRPPPFAEPDRLVVIWENDRATGTTRELASPADYFDFRARARTLSDLAMVAERAAVLTRSASDPIQIDVAAVTASLPGVLGIELQMGRPFVDADDVPGGPARAILSDGFWRTQLGGDPSVLGSALRIDERPYEIVGILPPDVEYPDAGTDVWIPLQEAQSTAVRYSHWVEVVGRLAPGATVEDAQTDLSRIMAELEAEYPQANVNRGAFVERLTDVGRGELRSTLWVLFASVLVVLAIACVNVANLLLARGTGRTQELAVLSAVGAAGRQLTRKFVVEGALLTAAGAIGGVLVALIGVRTLLAAAPPEASALGSPQLNASVLGFVLAIAVLVSSLFGLLPVLQTRRLDLQHPLKEGSRASGGRGGALLRRGLVAAQLSLAVALLLGATLLIRTLLHLQQVDLGFQPDHTLKAELALPTSRYFGPMDAWPDWPVVTGFLSRLQSETARLPGAQASAVVLNHPLDPGFTNSFLIDGRPYDPEQGEMSVRMVTSGYFEAVGLARVRGRALDPSDRSDSEPVVVINRRAADRYFPGADPLGSRISFWGSSRRIVGVVENERIQGITVDPPPAMYISLLQNPPRSGHLTLLVRTSAPPLALADGVRDVVHVLDAEVPVYNLSTMEDAHAEALARERFASLVLTVFAGVAVLLALLGVHGVLSYLVSQRRREVGVRLALGATPRDVVVLVLGEAARMIALGVGVGVVVAYGAARGLTGLLYGVSPSEPLTYAIVALTLAAAALLASVIPAGRAAGVDPISSLRSD